MTKSLSEAAPSSSNTDTTAEIPGDARGRLVAWDLATLGLGLLGLSPLLAFLTQRMWLIPERQFFVVTWLAVAIWALKSSLQTTPTPDQRRWTWGLACMVFASGLALYASWFATVWWSHIALIGWLLGWAMMRLACVPLVRIAGWMALLAGTIPWGSADQRIVGELHRTAAAWCGYALDALAVPNLRIAEIVETAETTLIAGQIWSGPLSLFALWSILIYTSLLQHRSLLVTLLSLAAGIFWITWAEFLLLLTVALKHNLGGISLLEGWGLHLLQVAAMAGATLVAWGTQVFLSRCLQPIPLQKADIHPAFILWNLTLAWPQPIFISPAGEKVNERDTATDDSEAIGRRPPNSFPGRWSKLGWKRSVPIVAALPIMVAGVAPSIAIVENGGLEFGLPTYAPSDLERLIDENDLPSQVENGKRIGFVRKINRHATESGRMSVEWQYLWKGQTAVAALRFPLPYWAEPGRVYERLGYRTLTRRWQAGHPGAATREDHTAASAPAQNIVQWGWEELELLSEFGGSSYVYTCDLDASLTPLHVPSQDARQRDSWFDRYRRSTVLQPWSHRFVLLVESGEPLLESEREELRAVFLALRSALKNKVSNSSGARSSQPSG